LDEIGALLELLAHRLDKLIRIVGVSGIRQDMLFGVVADGVLVPAQNVDRIPADSQPWSRDFAAINRVPDGGVGGSSAFGFHIPLSRETSHPVAHGSPGCAAWFD